MVRLAAFFVWLTLVTAAPTIAAPPQRSFEAQVQSNVHRLLLGPGATLAGPGAELIGRELADAQFFMVGEQHGTADIAQLNLGLHRLAAARGYHYAALEVGPHSTERIERLARAGRGTLAEFMRGSGRGFVFPFLPWTEETLLVEQIIALSPAPAPVLWGVDQEFVGSAPIHLDRLRADALTENQRGLIAELEQRAVNDPMLVATMKPADFQRLRSAFPAQRQADAATLIQDLMASNAIYAPFLTRSGSRHAANAARELLMKRQFLAHFSRAEARSGTPPKVFLKFGANHAMRGHSLTDVPALGNFLAEWGTSRGCRMVNVLADCVGGETSDLQSGSRSPCTPYMKLPPDSPLRKPAPNGQLAVFDLRPLRAAMPKDIDANTKRLILSFDFYIPVHGPRAASFITTTTPSAPQ